MEVLLGIILIILVIDFIVYPDDRPKVKKRKRVLHIDLPWWR